MAKTWSVLIVGVLVFVGVVLAPGVTVLAEDVAKAPQDNLARVADVAKALDAARKAAEDGDAKAALAEIAKARDALAQLKAAIEHTEGALVSPDNAKCPIMGMAVGKVPEALTRVYKGNRIGFCCHDCPNMWDRLSDVEKDRKFEKLGLVERKLVKVDNIRCPIMGMLVSEVPEKNVREYNGKKIGFCCKECPAAWDKLSDAEKDKKFAEAMATGEKLVKVDNVKCPIMGMAMTEAPEKNVREYKGKKIGFCCSDCTIAWDKLSAEEKDKKLAEVLPKERT